MYYLQSRYYDPVVGRFISPDDPAYIGANGDFISYNLYAYCSNNPVMGYDPQGTFDWKTCLSGVSLVSVGVGAIVAGGAILACASAPGLMVAIAVVTVAAGVLTVVNGTAEIIESVTGDNFVRDGIMNGNAEAYDTYKTITQIVASVGTAICASYYAYNGGNVCFVAGTMIAAATGQIAIEIIEVGDYVWALDTETGEKALKPVVNVFVNEASELVHVFTANDEIICTNEHPFYSPVKGWVSACQLRAGDILVLLNGEYIIVEWVQHEILESPVKVYNFEVEDFHTYFVGDDGILVHNTCNANNYRKKALEFYGHDGKNVEAHHLFPRAVERKTGFFSKAGINIHDSKNIRLMDPHIHRTTASDYNNLWYDFIVDNPNASVERIRHAAGIIMILSGANNGVII